MNIGVVGGGAIGLLISGYLAENHTITIYVRRKQQKEKINKHGLFISDSIKPIRVKSMLIENIKREDCFIICVKQAHIFSILPMISTIQEQIPLIFLQNGMSHLEIINQIKHPVILGVTEHGALRCDDHIVKQTGKGKIKLAAYNKANNETQAYITQLNQPNFPVVLASDWSLLLAEKLIINAVINPLTALFGVTNGEILHNSYIHTLAKKLCEEACLVLGLDFMEQWDRVREVARNTEENISSMLKDIEEHRKTEIEAITGYLIKHSNYTIPCTSFVYNSIKALEVKKGIKE